MGSVNCGKSGLRELEKVTLLVSHDEYVGVSF